MEKNRWDFACRFLVALFVSLHFPAGAVIAAGASETAVSTGSTVATAAPASAGVRWSGPALSGYPVTRVAVSPNFATDRTLFAGTANHLNFVSTDAGRTWRSSDLDTPSYGAGETQFTLSPDGSKVMKSTDFGRTWIPVLYPYPTPVFCWVAKSPTYAADQTVYANRNYYTGATFTKSTDGGATWSPVEGFDKSPVDTPEKIPFAFSPHHDSDRTIFYGRDPWDVRGPDHDIFTYRGATIFKTRLPDTVTGIVVSPQFAYDRTVYATTASGIWRSTDSGETWQKVCNVSGSLMHAPAHGTLFAETTAGLLRSDDRGATWQDLGFAADALYFSPDFATTLTIYAIHNSSGIYRSTDGGTTWSPINDGLYTTRVLSLAFSTDGGSLLVGTENGVYINWGVTPPDTDRSPPVISSFSLPPLSSSLVVPITSFTAADNIAGYCVQTVDSSAGCAWSPTPPSSYAFSDGGIGVLSTRTLYAFVRDTSGNVSRSRPATFSVVALLPPKEDFELANRGKLPWKGNWRYDDTVAFEGQFSKATPFPPFSNAGSSGATPTSSLAPRDEPKVPTPPYTPPSSRSELTVPTGEGVFSFRFKLHGMWPWGDSLSFSIDSMEWRTWRGEVDWTKVSIPISAGTHTFKWSYVKNGSGTYETAAAWIDDIEFPPAVSDTSAPSVTAFTIPSSSSAVTVPIAVFTASDDRGVAGYCVSEEQEASRCNWSAAKPESYSFGAIPDGIQASRTLYARVVDTSGNISDFRSATVTISLATRPTVISTTPPDGTAVVRTGGAVISAAFSQQMDPTGTSSENFTLSRSISFKAVAAGESHTVAVKSDGTVVAWGSTGCGITVPGVSDVVAVAAGRSHSLALKQDGSVVAWGDDVAGQRSVPVGLSGVVAIAAGSKHSLALKGDGTVVAWGDNSEGQGDVPVDLSDVKAIAAGGNNSVAVKRDGTVVQWGNNPDMVPAGLSGVAAVAAADHLTLALKEDGTLTAWGYNNFGQTNIPEGLVDVTAIAAGGTHLHALRRDGSVHSWGSRDFGVDSPPAGLSGVIALAAGSSYCVALKNDGTVVGWGSNAQGQGTVAAGILNPISVAAGPFHALAANGDGTVIAWGGDPNGPAKVPAGVSGVTAVAAGFMHSLALKQDGTVVAWGENYRGETEVPQGLTGVTAIAAGWSYSLALHGGKVSAWGDNTRGQLDVPADLSDVTAIAAGTFHSLALKSDGSVVGWGGEHAGQAAIPPEASGVIAIAAGERHSAVVKKDGTVFCWGGTGFYDVTKPPPGLTGVIAVAAGRDSTLALRNDGTVVQWGRYTPPEGLTGVVAISAWWSTFLALKKDGTVVAWGENTNGVLNVPVVSHRVAGTVSWDADRRNATFTPAAPLLQGESYLASVNGRSSAGIRMAAPVTWRFATPQPPVLLTTPPAVSNSREAKFSFYSNHRTAMFRCKLDHCAFFTCSTPHSFGSLSEGNHNFTVEALDGNGEIIAAATSYNWTVDSVAPSTAATPPGGSYLAGQTVSLTCSDSSGTGCGAIRYTTDGSLPIHTSAVYSGPITVTETTTVRFFAADLAGNAEAPKSVTVVIVPGHAVHLQFAGAGAGTVHGDPPGFSSSTGTSRLFPAGAEVTLYAIPAPGSSFSGWSGACTGVGACTLTIDAAKEVTATFTFNSYNITVATGGHAIVTSIPAGITCGGVLCSGSFPYGTAVTLMAAPLSGYFFTGWSGGSCSGTGTCAVRIEGALSLTADTSPGQPVTVTVQGTGSGSVSSIPSGIACMTGSSTGCSSFFTPGLQVSLAGTASDNSTFSGWGGACSGKEPCRLTVDGAKNVTASFSLAAGKVLIEGEDKRYATLQAALGAIVTSGVTIRATSGSFPENVLHSTSFPVMIRGGYADAAYSTRGAPSVIVGSLTIRSGTLRVERLAVR